MAARPTATTIVNDEDDDDHDDDDAIFGPSAMGREFVPGGAPNNRIGATTC